MWFVIIQSGRLRFAVCVCVCELDKVMSDLVAWLFGVGKQTVIGTCRLRLEFFLFADDDFDFDAFGAISDEARVGK